MVDLKNLYTQEPKSKKMLLGCGLVALVSTFLPWYSVSFGPLGGVSLNGWHSYGFFTIFGSILLLLLWGLPHFGVKFTLPLKEDLAYKILALAMLAGPILWLLESSFEFSIIGFGIYVAIASGAVGTYFAFKK